MRFMWCCKRIGCEKETHQCDYMLFKGVLEDCINPFCDYLLCGEHHKELLEEKRGSNEFFR